MAVTVNGQATGAEQRSQDLRRRNVPQGNANGSVTHIPEKADDQKSRKVQCASSTSAPNGGRCLASDCADAISGTVAATVNTIDPGRMGVFDSTHHLHGPCLFYTHVQDWVVANSNMG